jgi:hypothetical protein
LEIDIGALLRPRETRRKESSDGAKVASLPTHKPQQQHRPEQFPFHSAIFPIAELAGASQYRSFGKV